MNDKTEQTDRGTAINDVVADALGSAYTMTAAHAIDDKALLAKYGFEEIEVTFAMRDPMTGEVLREKEACYQLKADGFYGKGMHATWFHEGDIIVSHDVPNQHMEPQNRAAALAFARWIESLPQNRVTIDIGDMSEAAVILAKDPRMTNGQLTPAQAQFATIKVAEGLKLRREGKNAMDLRVGEINRNFAPQSGGKAPPMLGAKMSDMSQIGPGMTRGIAAVSGPGAGIRKASPLGGPPPGR